MSIASQLSFSTATSVRGGALGSIPYQNATSSTVFVSIGAAGTVLTSSGTTPIWALASSTTVGTSTQVNTVLQTGNATYYPTFVDSNNATSIAEAVYTTSSFNINAQSGDLNIGSRLTFSTSSGATGVVTLTSNVTAGIVSLFSNVTTNGVINLGGLGLSTINIGGASSTINLGSASGNTDVRIGSGGAATLNATGNVPIALFASVTTNTLTVGGSGAGRLALTYNQSASSTSTGALTVVGGVGVGGTLYVDRGAIIGNSTFAAWGPIYRALQIGVTSALYGVNSGFGGNTTLSDNVYITSGGTSTYLLTNYATKYSQNLGSGIHAWYTATSGTAGNPVTFVESMRITNRGGIGFGATGATGTAGQVLQSNGDAPPTWVPVASATVTTSTQVQTVLRSTAATHFLTFVDSNNASATAESLYTTSSFVINPATGNIGLGITPTVRFQVTATTNIIARMNGSVGVTGLEISNYANKMFVGDTNVNNSIVFDTANNAVSILASSGGERVIVNSSALIVTGTSGGGGNSLVLRGGTLAASEGPQIVLGYGNNTSSAILGQANNSWNIDIASGLANNNFRIFRQNSAGATVVAAEITEASGGIQLVSIGVGTTSSGITGEIRATNEITAYFSSDIKLKENIRLIADPITIVNQIRGVYYDWTDEHIKARGGEDGYFVRKHDIGVIAQEVEAVLPEIVATRDDGTKVVKYEKLVALLIEAVKDQQRQINQISQALQNLAIK